VAEYSEPHRQYVSVEYSRCGRDGAAVCDVFFQQGQLLGRLAFRREEW
jgi:hypothetical protein